MARNLPRSMAITCLILLAGCDAESFTRLTLPEGDAARGQELFVSYQCTACHTIKGLQLARPENRPDYDYGLGGHGRKSYHELVTSVINPSHSVPRRFRSDDNSQSPMVVYNDVMSVTDLIDLVTFLESQYMIQNVQRYRYVPLRPPG